MRFHAIREIFVSHFPKGFALSRDLQKCLFAWEKIIYRDAQNWISRWFRGRFLSRTRDYDITWVNEIQSEFQCIVTNTHLDRSIDLFPINDFHYDIINDFRSKNEVQASSNLVTYKMSTKKITVYWKMRSGNFCKEKFMSQPVTCISTHYENYFVTVYIFTLFTSLFPC